MKIQLGFDLMFDCVGYTPMVFMLNVHPSRAHDLLTSDTIRISPARSFTQYVDGFGNKCVRVLAPPGELRIFGDCIISDTGKPDSINPAAQEHPVADLPHEALAYLLASRYCETDLLMDRAWALFGNAPTGWQRVQAICDFVHRHIAYNYQHANSQRGAVGAFEQRKGVCRDFAHLAVTFCRCLNIPARYCSGYLGDIGVPTNPAPMDFSAWFEAFVGGRWYTFDPRYNVPRIGRVLIARGRDAADCAISTTFAPNTLSSFRVTTHEFLGAVPRLDSRELVA
jgi:transglutaminase-like putative cysteine protease